MPARGSRSSSSIELDDEPAPTIPQVPDPMSHLDPARPTSRAELRKFGLLVGGAFLALAAISFLRHKSPTTYTVLGSAGTALFVLGAVVPGALGPVYAGWMRFALLLSKITTPIFMGVIYFIVIAPMGWLMRVFGKRPLAAPSSTESAWTTRPPESRASSLDRQF